MPSRERVRADEEALPPVPGQNPSRRRKERAIRRGEEDSPATALEDLELVVEHDGLKIQLIEATADEQAEQPAQKPVSDGPEHLGSLMPGGWLANGQVGVADRVSLPTGKGRRRVSGVEVV